MATATKHRKRGRGTVYQRKDGLWIGELQRTEDGRKQRFRVNAKTPEGVEAKLATLKLRISRGEIPGGRPAETVGELLDDWLERSIRPRRKATTYSDYLVTIRVNLRPHIGDLKLDKLTPRRIEAHYEDLEAAGVGARSRQKAHVALGAALRYAFKRDLIASNPIEKVSGPVYHRGPIHPWNEDEARAFVKAIRGDELEALYLLALYGGLRQGECLGLQRTDIDLNAGAVYVQHSLQNVAGHRLLTSAKTDGSRRRIDLPKSVVASLRAHLKRLDAAKNPSTYAFPDVTGNGRSKSNFMRRSFLPLLERAGLRRIRFHDLRHTCASLLLSRGVSPKVVQERLGHSRISTTMDTYSHVAPSMQQDASDELESMLSRKRRP